MLLNQTIELVMEDAEESTDVDEMLRKFPKNKLRLQMSGIGHEKASKEKKSNKIKRTLELL